MIVAMLLGPITGIGLALVESDMALLWKSLSTLLGGVVGVVVTAFILGTIHKDIPITNEIMARTAPNLLDLMIGLAGGAAGAYATVSPRLSVAFVGVAMPPLWFRRWLPQAFCWRVAKPNWLLALFCSPLPT